MQAESNTIVSPVVPVIGAALIGLGVYLVVAPLYYRKQPT